MLYLDLKYINLLSNHFDRFVRKSEYLFNVRCPICGDSQMRKTKMRGYLYRVKDSMAFKCHNCNCSMGFGNLLKHLNPELHKEWTLEFLKEQRPLHFAAYQSQKERKGFNQSPVRFGVVDQVVYQNAEKISDLPDLHFCKTYIRERKIPEKYWSKLYFSPSFKLFADEVSPDHGKEITKDPRLVIPYYDAYGSVIAISGRDLLGKPDALRYITIRVDSTNDRKLVYGLDHVDQSKPIMVVEGPLDSLFLNNTVASGDSNLMLVAKQLSAKDITLVFDNEPRNKEIVDQMTQAIRGGYKICVWSKWIKQKDINEMILSGLTPEELQKIIKENSFTGLMALTHLTTWKKV